MMKLAEVTPESGTETVLNLTKSIAQLDAFATGTANITSPYQPYCAGAGMRTTFLGSEALPFTPFDGELHSDSYTDIVRLDEGFYLRLINDTQRKTAALLAPGEDWLKLSFVLNGAIVQCFDQGDAHINGAGYGIIYWHPPGITKSEMVDNSCWGTSVTLYLSRQQFLSVLPEETRSLPRSLIDYSADRLDSFMMETIPLTQTITRNVLDIVKTPYVADLRHLFMKAKAMELLCEVMYRLTHREQWQAPGLKLSARDRRQIELARRIISDNYVQAPTICELARHVGINQRKLKTGFKQLFGTTIFDFAQSLRLDEAWSLLNSGDYNISQVADRVGYSYSKNFTTAFKKHFGVSPKAARCGASQSSPL